MTTPQPAATDECQQPNCGRPYADHYFTGPSAWCKADFGKGILHTTQLFIPPKPVEAEGPTLSEEESKKAMMIFKEGCGPNSFTAGAEATGKSDWVALQEALKDPARLKLAESLLKAEAVQAYKERLKECLRMQRVATEQGTSPRVWDSIKWIFEDFNDLIDETSTHTS